MKLYYSCFACDIFLTDAETFKVIKDDDFGHRYFCRECLNKADVKLSQGIVWELTNKGAQA